MTSEGSFRRKCFWIKGLGFVGVVYTDPVHFGSFEMGIEDVEGLGEFALRLVELFELVGDFGFAALAGDANRGSEADAVEAIEEGVHGPVESGFSSGLAEQERGHQIAEDAQEEMDGDLLIGPMELRPYRQVVGVLDVLESAFNLGLVIEGLDDVGAGPVVPIRHEDAKPECFFEFGARALFDGEGQFPWAGVGFGEGPLEQVLEELALDDPRDAGLNLLAGLPALGRGVDGLL